MGVCIDELLLLSSKLINFHDDSELEEDLIGMQKFGYLGYCGVFFSSVPLSSQECWWKLVDSQWTIIGGGVGELPVMD